MKVIYKETSQRYPFKVFVVNLYGVVNRAIEELFHVKRIRNMRGKLENEGGGERIDW